MLGQYLLLGLLAIAHCDVLAQDLGGDMPGRPNILTRSRFCRAQNIVNGRVKLRGKGRISKFACDSGFEMVGKRFATCVRGSWSNPPPVCVAPGCPLSSIKNGMSYVTHGEALVHYFCDFGYKIVGSKSIYCDGQSWNSTVPNCIPAIQNPATICQFESEDLCGWLHDDNQDFLWTRQNFATPSGHVGTGPSHDYTLGEGKDGFYMYIEGSSPRKENDTARLWSPVYRGSLRNDRCFAFWYHMYGATSGYLKVYVKPESFSILQLSPAFVKAGDQGNKWIRGVIPLQPSEENFQIIIEGVRGSSYVSDTAVDDVMIGNGTDCDTAEEGTPGNSESTQVTVMASVTFTSTPTMTTTGTTTTTTTTPQAITVTSPTVIFNNKSSPTTRPPEERTQSSMTTLPTVATTETPETPVPTTTTTTTTTATTTTTTAATTTEAAITNISNPQTPIRYSTRFPPAETLPPKPLFPRRTTTTMKPPEEVQKLEHSSQEQVGIPKYAVAAIVITIIVVTGGIVGAGYVLFRRRRFEREKMVDDSDIRYLKDGELQMDVSGGGIADDDDSTL